VLHNFMVWLQTELGKGSDGVTPSWSEGLLSTANFWGLLEGTHLLCLMLFAGTIFIVDLRLLGVIFKRTPVSVISEKLLPLTVFGFVLVVVTGAALFFAKPLVYYHNIWFRGKMIFLALAMINIVVFHYRVQRNISQWDTLEKPPGAARTSAALSLAAWLCVITMGRFIAYDWYECGKSIPHWINVVEECASTEYGAKDLTPVSVEGVAK
jgi:hypothetical protein